MKRYPAIEFIARHGRRVALGLGSLVMVTMVLLAASLESVALGAAGLVAGGVVWALARVGVEVVEVVADTLLPR